MPRNTLLGGMVSDNTEALSPPNTYRLALNAVHKTDDYSNFGLANERSFRQVVDTGGDIKGATYIETMDATVLFVADGSSTVKLFYHETEELVDVFSDSEMGCDWKFDQCEHIYAEHKTHNACDDEMIYFSSDCVYYVLNLTEMLDPVRRNNVINCEECDYFTIFDCICGPIGTATPIPFAGSTAQGGAVSFHVQLEDASGNRTNWFRASNTAYMLTENNAP